MYAAFYSDPHFGHDNIIEYTRRPFVSVDHMTDHLVNNYNAVVKPDDVVLWLGDAFFFRRKDAKPRPDGRLPQGYPVEKAMEIMKILPGQKVLVRGNHDLRKSATFYKRLGFEDVIPGCVLTIAGRTCRVSHWPYVNDEPRYVPLDPGLYKHNPKRMPGEILLHGHTHFPEKVRGNMIHLGVDAWGYRPVLLSEVERLVVDQPTAFGGACGTVES